MTRTKSFPKTRIFNDLIIGKTFGMTEDGFRTFFFLVVLSTLILLFRNCCVSIYSKVETKVDGVWGPNTVVFTFIR